MPQTIRFNTWRKYTANGQRIVATLHDDNVVTFFDHSRGIDGGFFCHYPKLFDRQMVMYIYDNNTYTSNRRSWADGMLRNGYNSKWEE